MHILFVNHHHLDSNSGVHIFNLANHLTQLGVMCTVCVPNQKETAKVLGDCKFDIFEFDELTRRMRPGLVDIIHAWTPRERVRMMTEILAHGCNAPYVVHLEDNEENILEANLDVSVKNLLDLSNQQLDALIPRDFAHPVRYKQFIDQARGVTMVINTLSDFCPKTKVQAVIWPGYEENLQWFLPADEALRQRLNITPKEYVVVYTGNVHSANRQEVLSLYLAVGLLNRCSVPTKLVRTGTDNVRLCDDSLKILDQFCIPLGHIPRNQLPNILSIADVLVQPGKDDKFNKYRFPSKLPEYFASRKPVLLPAANIGRIVKDQEEAIVLQQGNALEIAQKLEALFPDREQRRKIGEAGYRFAESNLRWSHSAKKLFILYQQVLSA